MRAPAPLVEVFAFFENPRNLARITPPWLNFQVMDRGEIEMKQGAEIDYVIRWQGIPMRWRTRITDYSPPRSFIDEQIRGPYALWRHRHEFRQDGDVTLITDCVDYEMPLGILGRLAHAVMVGGQLKEIFAYRQRTIAKLLGWPGITYSDPVIRPLA